MTYHEGIYKHAQIMKEDLAINKEVTLKVIANYYAPLELTVELYVLMVRKGLTPIEEMEPEEKKELWEYAKELAPGKGKNWTIKVCKALQAFGNYVQ